MTAIAIPARQRHVLAFGKPLGLADEQIDATVAGDSGDPAEIRWLLQMCGRMSDKQLQASIDIGITQTLSELADGDQHGCQLIRKPAVYFADARSQLQTVQRKEL